MMTPLLVNQVDLLPREGRGASDSRSERSAGICISAWRCSGVKYVGVLEVKGTKSSTDTSALPGMCLWSMSIASSFLGREGCSSGLAGKRNVYEKMLSGREGGLFGDAIAGNANARWLALFPVQRRAGRPGLVLRLDAVLSGRPLLDARERLLGLSGIGQHKLYPPGRARFAKRFDIGAGPGRVAEHAMPARSDIKG